MKLQKPNANPCSTLERGEWIENTERNREMEIAMIDFKKEGGKKKS